VKWRDYPQMSYIKSHTQAKLHKLVTHFWNACNLACHWCFVNKVDDEDWIVLQNAKKRYSDEMSIETQVSLFREAKELGAKTVDIVGSWEPTLDPNFKELVQEIEDLWMWTVIFTHWATPLLLKKEKLAEYADKDVSFFIKLWSFDSEKQNWYVKSKTNNYSEQRDVALQNLIDLWFNKWLSKDLDGIEYNSTRIAADILVMKSNIDEIPDIFRYCRENNIMPEIKTYIPEWPTKYDHMQWYFKQLTDTEQAKLKKDMVDWREFAELRKELERIDKEEFWIEPIPYFYPQAFFCTQSMGSVYVTIRWDIFACVGTWTDYWKYEANTNSLENYIENRKEKVWLWCMPRVIENKLMWVEIPKEELEILTLWDKYNK